MPSHLVIFDPHVSPGQSLERFEWLGKLIRDERPDVVVCGGDFATLDSMSFHDTKGSATERRQPTLTQDAEACKEAQRLMFGQIHHTTVKRIRRVFLEGNHEHRFKRWAELNPNAADAINFRELFGFTRWWSEIHPYKSYATVDGVDYTHIPHNIMGRPIGGVYKARTVCLNSSRSCIFGHGHDLQVHTQALFSRNEKRLAIAAPAFMPDGHVEPYARDNMTGWMYGLLRVRPQRSGPPAFDYISMSDLKEMYS